MQADRSESAGGKKRALNGRLARNHLRSHNTRMRIHTLKNFGLWLLLCSMVLPVHAQDARRFFPEKDLMTVGIYYYPEHWDPGQWERDIKKIASMGFEFVHLAEFAWTQMEPEEGTYDFTWLDRVVDLCAKNHLKVLLCTPSATTPAWMRDRYPETFVMEGHYIRSEHGTRGLGSIVNPRYRTFVEKIVTEMAKRYGNNPAVVGWQLDNEPDAKPDYSPASQEAFRQWLRKKYVTIDALNTDWGTAFWSQRYARFDEVIIPNTTIVGWWGNNPHALLDFKRYSADAQAEFLDFQAAILRKYISQSQYITTNYTAVSQGADPRRTTLLDFATFTSYPNGGQPNIGSLGFRLGDNRPLTFANDLYRTITGVTGIMELQPGAVNWGDPNPLLLPGTVRMWLWYNFGAGSSLAS
ncbi:MAG TPA: beta-galactosidase, partial [Bacteroidota bacterium]|nr:beta-galactosidase [Bacteroidota bacterium]